MGEGLGPSLTAVDLLSVELLWDGSGIGGLWEVMVCIALIVWGQVVGASHTLSLPLMAALLLLCLFHAVLPRKYIYKEHSLRLSAVSHQMLFDGWQDVVCCRPGWEEEACLPRNRGGQNYECTDQVFLARLYFHAKRISLNIMSNSMQAC